MKSHVFAVPTGEGFTAPGILLGEVETISEAIAICEQHRFECIPEGAGGCYDRYDADDAPLIYGYDHDGLGAISITVASA